MTQCHIPEGFEKLKGGDHLFHIELLRRIILRWALTLYYGVEWNHLAQDRG